MAARTSASTWTTRTITAPAAGMTVTNGDGVAGNPTLVLADDLNGLEGLGTSGVAVRTGTSTWTTRTITGSGGVTVTNGDGVTGAPAISLSGDGDLVAIEALSGTGFPTRTGTATWTQRSVTGTANQITVTNGDGVSGAPTISLPADVVIPTIITAPNSGLHILDTNASHDLIITPGSDLTADRVLTITTGDAARTLDVSAGSVTISTFGASLIDDAAASNARATLSLHEGLSTGTIVDAKGDLISATADNTPARLAVGADGTVLTADSTQSTGLGWVVGFSTGDVKLTIKTTADTGWVLMNDGSIGSASSGATTRANADTTALYTLLWNNTINQWCPVAGGRGGSAAADFAANKAITLPRALGRALATFGTATQTESGVDADVTLATDTLAVPSNNSKWFTGMQVTFTLSSGTITGLTSGNTYYVIRNSATLIKLATTLALAQAGTAIDLTAKSTPVWTITHNLTARVMGEVAGEEGHALATTEIPALASAFSVANFGGNGGSAGDFVNGGGTTIYQTPAVMSGTGANAHNNMQPSLFLNTMIKL
jgi:hypothetical protein